MKKMNEKPGHVRPANDFYAKLNALMFVPQKELSGDQAYWLSANEIASQASKSATPATPFVHKSRPPSQVLASLRKVNAGVNLLLELVAKLCLGEPLGNLSSLPDKSANARRQVPKGSLWYLDSGCSITYDGDRARLINFVEKFIGTVRFGNDEYAAIVGYGDYKLGDTIISRVYYVEGLKHNLFSVGQFCDGGLEVAFRQHSCHIRNYDMVDPT
ncbi:hypothetical protein Tco_0336026 [Tanacetum coccineum]